MILPNTIEHKIWNLSRLLDMSCSWACECFTTVHGEADENLGSIFNNGSGWV
jgi:hypothetical protein